MRDTDYLHLLMNIFIFTTLRSCVMGMYMAIGSFEMYIHELSLSAKMYWCVTVHNYLPPSFLCEMKVIKVK